MLKFKYKTSVVFLFIALFTMGIVFYVLSMLASLPEVSTLKGCLTTHFNHVYLCNKSKNYTPLPYISKNIVNAILISEDASFLSHNGFEFYEIQESFKRNFKDVKFSRGGSTITQQLAKNVFLTSEKSISRKLKEAYLTYQMEEVFTKNQILEKYLNVIELGPNIYGVQQASHYYFKKNVSDISPAEAVYLAYLMPNPKSYSKSFAKKTLTVYAKNRMKNLLLRMYKYHKIDYPDYENSVDHIDRIFKTESEIAVNKKEDEEEVVSNIDPAEEVKKSGDSVEEKSKDSPETHPAEEFEDKPLVDSSKPEDDQF